MSVPRFSIVIPTRERARSLYHTLRTCIMQKFDDFEIVVCDNCSSSETKQVVDSLGSGKIKYVRSGVPLAMSDNWELALSHAVGEYVIVIGDDDGLLPNALTDLDLFIVTTRAKAIRWAVVTYLWPEVEGGLAANKIHIPAPVPTILIDSHQAIKSVVNGEKDYSYLPMLYYSAIHRDLIQDLKNRAGRVFKSNSPDIYTAFAVGYVAKKHYLIGKPLSIVGYSGRSNGVANLFSGGEASIIEETLRLNKSAGYSFHAQVPNIPVMSAAVASEFLHVKQVLFPQEDQFVLDRKQLIINCIKDLENFNRVENKEWGAFMHTIEESLRDDNELQRWFQKTFLEHYEPKGKPWIFSQAAWQDGLTTGSLYLDGKEFGVSDVFGAAILSEKFISQSTPFTDVVKQSESSITPQLPQDLIDKDKVIQKLRQDLLAKEIVIQSYRRSVLSWILYGPFGRFIPFRGWLAKLGIRARFLPKLGVLYQYPPRPLRTPVRYHKEAHLPDNELPVISIVTPSYNQAIFLDRTIQSVFSQEYPKLEYVIRDGKSTDGSADVIEKYRNQLSHAESITDEGQANAINIGFRHTTGQIMAYLNSDDMLLPGTLHFVARYFARHPDVDVVYGHRVIVDENDDKVGIWVLPPHDRKMLEWGDYVPQETMFWRREIWEKSGGKMDETFKFVLDWDLLLRFQQAGARIVRLPRFLALFRVHDAQKSTAQINDLGLREMNLLRQRIHGREVQPDEINRNLRAYLMRSVIFHKLYRLGFLRY